MNVLTLKIPEALDAALQAARRTRGLSKSAVVPEALEQSWAVKKTGPVQQSAGWRSGGAAFGIGVSAARYGQSQGKAGR